MFYVYCLQSQKRKEWFYIGYSSDLRQRFMDHQQGKVYSTSRYLPLRLVYYEAYLDKDTAAKREYELKHNNQQKEILKSRIIKSLVI